MSPARFFVFVTQQKERAGKKKGSSRLFSHLTHKTRRSRSFFNSESRTHTAVEEVVSAPIEKARLKISRGNLVFSISGIEYMGTIRDVVDGRSIECHAILIIAFRHFVVRRNATAIIAGVVIVRHVFGVRVNGQNHRGVIGTLGRGVNVALITVGATDGVVIRGQVIRQSWAPAAHVNVNGDLAFVKRPIRAIWIDLSPNSTISITLKK